ncbi:MAG: methyltransferase [Candidatus Nitrosocaldus sp.]
MTYMNHDGIYKPAEDTFMLADAVYGLQGNNALEIGTGSGYIAAILGKRFNRVVATDISLEALLYAKNNSNSRNVEFVCCNCADAISSKFDLIAINPPYLPSERIEDVTVDGGKKGIEVAMEMLKSTSGLLKEDEGRIVMIASSLAGYDELLSSLHNLGLYGNTVARKRYGFEDLILLEIRPLKYATRQHQDHQV